MKTLMLSAAVLLITSPAMADLIGTTMDLHLEQSGLIGQMAGPTSGVHTYGTTTIIELAPGVKITERNFGRDRRYPITNKFRERL